MLSVGNIVTSLLFQCYYQSLGYGTRSYVLSKINLSIYCIVNTNTLVQSIIPRRFRYQYQHGKKGEYKMTYLCADKTRMKSSFAHIGLDMFLLFIVKQFALFSFVCKFVIFT